MESTPPRELASGGSDKPKPPQGLKGGVAVSYGEKRGVNYIVLPTSHMTIVEVHLERWVGVVCKRVTIAQH